MQAVNGEFQLGFWMGSFSRISYCEWGVSAGFLSLLWQRGWGFSYFFDSPPSPPQLSSRTPFEKGWKVRGWTVGLLIYWRGEPNWRVSEGAKGQKKKTWGRKKRMTSSQGKQDVTYTLLIAKICITAILVGWTTWLAVAARQCCPPFIFRVVKPQEGGQSWKNYLLLLHYLQECLP